MNHEKARDWLHGDRVEYSGCRAAAEAMQYEIDRLSDKARLYEELRSVIDGGSESMTHKDALAEVKYLQFRVAELEAARGEPGVWLRDQRGSYEGPETLDPMFYLGAADPGRGAHGATYSPFYPAPPVQARGEPVAWIGATALDALDEQRRSREPGYVLVEVCDSESADYEIALYTAPPAPTVDVDAISYERIHAGVDAMIQNNKSRGSDGFIYYDDMRAALRAIFDKGECRGYRQRQGV